MRKRTENNPKIKKSDTTAKNEILTVFNIDTKSIHGVKN
jgi:hypothetical protein